MSQEKESFQVAEIDSLLLKVQPNPMSQESYLDYKKTLSKSKALKYAKGEFTSYLNLMLFFGQQKKLDSMMYYATKFEDVDFKNIERKLVYRFFFTKAESLLINFDQNEQSLEEFLRAYKYIDENDAVEVVRIKNMLAFIYLTKKRFDKTIKELKPLVDGDSFPHPAYKLQTLTILAQAYQNNFDPTSSYPINLEALRIAKSINDTTNIYLIKTNIINDYFLKGEFQKAIDSGLNLIEPLKKYKPENLPANAYNLSIAYDSIGKTNKAIRFMNEAITSNNSDYNQVELLSILSYFYEKQGDYKNSVISLKKKLKIVDSIRSKEQKAFVDLYDTKIKIIKEQREKEAIESEKKLLLVKSKKQKQYIVLLFIGLISIVLIVLSGWIYFKYFKSKAKIKELKNKERVILKNHILVRETELSLHAHNKIKWLSQLSEIKNKLSDAITQNDKNDVNEVQSYLEELYKELTNNDVFSKRLESQYPKMVISLKKLHPLLSPNEIRQCLLVKLGLSLKESAQLMNVGVGAIKMGRSRAKTKMNLAKEVSLKMYLDKIENELG